jgi:hypothetical protein
LEKTDARRCVPALEGAVEIEAGELVAIVTDERIQLPGCVPGTIFPKGRMPLLGLATASTTIDPGFNGHSSVHTRRSGLFQGVTVGILPAAKELVHLCVAAGHGDREPLSFGNSRPASSGVSRSVLGRRRSDADD